MVTGCCAIERRDLLAAGVDRQVVGKLRLRQARAACGDRRPRALEQALALGLQGVAPGAEDVPQVARQRAQTALVQRAGHAAAALVQNVGVDHGRADVGVAEQLLHGADVVAAFQQVGGEGMAQGVRRRRLVDARLLRRRLHRALHDLVAGEVHVLHPQAQALPSGASRCRTRDRRINHARPSMPASRRCTSLVERTVGKRRPRRARVTFSIQGKSTANTLRYRNSKADKA
jgi:hypothetical protein